MIGAHLSLTHWSKHPWNDSTIVIKFIKRTIFIISLRFLFKVFKCLDFIKDLKDVQSNLNDTWCRKHFWQDYFEGRKKFLPISKIRRSLLSQHSLNNLIQPKFHHRNLGSLKILTWLKFQDETDHDFSVSLAKMTPKMTVFSIILTLF